MKQIIKFAAFFLITVFLFASCQKEIAVTIPPTTPPVTNNQPPVANAGFDQTITFPTDSVELSGSGTDADGTIVSYSWSKVSGPSSFNIINSNIAVTKVKNLVEGVYEFELKVTDDHGLSEKDKVVVTVVSRPVINMQLIPVGALSVTRDGAATATAGNKILFAGGHIGAYTTLSLFSRVDIYDMSTQTWSTAELSEARTGIGAATVGNKILFAGGAKNNHPWYEDEWINFSTRVDIYDVSTNSWTTTELPEPIHFLGWQGITAVVGNKAFFCGGINRSIVYIYDVVQNSWSTANLSVEREDFAAASVGNKILITGGSVSNNVDIYDASTNTWSIDSLSEALKYRIAATLNNKAFFAGGRGEQWQFSNKVDIYDNATQSWSTAYLGRATVLAGAAPFGQMMLFFGGYRVDIYDATSNTWSIADLNQYFDDFSAIVAAGGNIYATNGSQVWRVQF